MTKTYYVLMKSSPTGISPFSLLGNYRDEDAAITAAKYESVYADSKHSCCIHVLEVDIHNCKIKQVFYTDPTDPATASKED